MAHTNLPDPHAVTTDARLEALIGSPDERIKMKLRAEIDDMARAFIERSPFVVVATADADGRLDASPKGDPPGFVHVIDSTTLAIPERKGNALGFGPRNVLATGRIGLIFMVPGQRETYRVNGTARLTSDPELLDRLAVSGRPALMATLVEVEEAFFHCGKSMIRANLWSAPDDAEADRRPIAEQIGELLGDKSLVSVIAADLEQNYQDGSTDGRGALRCGEPVVVTSPRISSALRGQSGRPESGGRTSGLPTTLGGVGHLQHGRHSWGIVKNLHRVGND